MPLSDLVANYFKSKGDIELPNESGKVDSRLPAKKKKKGIFDKYNPFKAYGDAIDEATSKPPKNITGVRG